MRLVTRMSLAVGGLLAILLVVAFGPALVRRDILRYQWAGSIGSGIFDQPMGVAYTKGLLFVSDAARNRIVVLDTAGFVVAIWDDSTTGLLRPMHLSVGTDGLLYVAEYLKDRITALDSTGTVVRRIGERTGSGLRELDAPGGAVELGGTVFVADFFNHRIMAFLADTTWIIGLPGRVLRRRLHYPTDVAASDSLLFVGDAYNHRIQVFTPDGRYVRRWGGPLGLGVPGPLKGWFSVATGIDVVAGRVYVADFFNGRVQVFDEHGRYLGTAADSLRLPTDVAVGANGELFVTDVGHERVTRFTPLNTTSSDNQRPRDHRKH